MPDEQNRTDRNCSTCGSDGFPCSARPVIRRGFLGSSGYGRVDVDASEPEIDVQLLDVNPYSGRELRATGSPGS